MGCTEKILKEVQRDGIQFYFGITSSLPEIAAFFGGTMGLTRFLEVVCLSDRGCEVATSQEMAGDICAQAS
jgi:hypothetical protein